MQSNAAYLIHGLDRIVQNILIVASSYFARIITCWSGIVEIMLVTVEVVLLCAVFPAVATVVLLGGSAANHQ